MNEIHTRVALRLAEIAGEARAEAAGHADVYVREELLRIAKGLDRVINELAKPRALHPANNNWTQTNFSPASAET